MKSLADTLGLNTPEAPTQAPQKLTAKALSKKILQSPEYIASIIRRITLDTLPAAVECKLYDYAFGKPVDKVEVKDTTDHLESMSSEELEARAMALAALAAKLRATDDSPSVH